VTRGDRNQRPAPATSRHGQEAGSVSQDPNDGVRRPQSITVDLSEPAAPDAATPTAPARAVDNLPLSLLGSLGLPFVQRAGSVWLYLLADGAPLQVKLTDHGDHIALAVTLPASGGAADSEQNGVRISRDPKQTLVWMLLGRDALSRPHLTAAIARLASVAAPLVPTQDVD
jgi:hypothetical protein